MSTALIVEYYRQLPQRRDQERGEEWKRRLRAANARFKKQVARRYQEGTLTRLLVHPDALTRRAAVAALALLGTVAANKDVAARLHDEDADVRRAASDALWKLWFRGDSEVNNLDLQRLSRLRDREKARVGLDELIQKAPHFAEAYNQRAVLWFGLRQYERSLADCERTLELNPFHFGAQAGMGQCYLQLRKHRAALKAFRQALRINPNLDDIAETIRALETTLGEEGRRDDKK